MSQPKADLASDAAHPSDSEDCSLSSESGVESSICSFSITCNNISSC